MTDDLWIVLYVKSWNNGMSSILLTLLAYSFTQKSPQWKKNYFQGLWIPINLLLETKPSDCTNGCWNVHVGKSCFHNKVPTWLSRGWIIFQSQLCITQLPMELCNINYHECSRSLLFILVGETTFWNDKGGNQLNSIGIWHTILWLS